MHENKKRKLIFAFIISGMLGSVSVNLHKRRKECVIKSGMSCVEVKIERIKMKTERMIH